MDMLKVVAVRRDAEGNISQYKLDNGEELSKKQCEQYINSGRLDLICAKGRSGATVIRSQADSDCNLTELPTF